MSSASRARSLFEYEDWPRERIVYHRPTERFTIYANRKLMTLPTVACIAQRFGLAIERFDVQGDARRRSVEIPGPLK